MKRLIICICVLLLITSFTPPMYANDAQGIFFLKGVIDELNENSRKRKAAEEAERQRRMQEEYLIQRQREVEAQQERNRIEQERLEKEKREAYERKYWEGVKNSRESSIPDADIPAQPVPAQSVNKAKPVIKGAKPTQSISAVMSVKVGKIGRNDIIYTVPVCSKWNPNPCVLEKYESVPCESCPSGYKTDVKIRNKEEMKECWQENPHYSPLGGDKNYQVLEGG